MAAASQWCGSRVPTREDPLLLSRLNAREAQIDAVLAVGVGENPREALSEFAKLGARLLIQRAVEDEFDAARYERRPEAPPGLRNGFRPRRVQTAEGELSVEIPQVREAAEPFVSKLFPRAGRSCCAPSR
jgi:transposase-like protein